MAIFSHQDCDGDAIDLLAEDDWQEDLVLLYSNRAGDKAGGVRIDREAARRLYDALAVWLTGEVLERPRGSSAEDIRTMVREEHEKLWAPLLATVKPLWEAARALGVIAPDENRYDSKLQEICVGGYGCDFSGVHLANGSGCGRPDPEPHDVGHPDPLTAEPQAGQPAWAERSSGAPGDASWHRPLAGNSESIDRGRLMAELPRRVRPRGECTCEHETVYPHRAEYSGCTRTGCTCKYVAGTS